MKKTTTRNRKPIAMLVIALLLAFGSLTGGGALLAGSGVRADETPDFNAKLIARYTFEELTGTNGASVVAKDKNGNTVSTLNATGFATAGQTENNAREGRYAGSFNSSRTLKIPKEFIESGETGFTFSAWVKNTGNDWNSFLATGNGTRIALPNLDPGLATDAEATGWAINMYPADDNKLNGHQWDSFFNSNSPYTQNSIAEWMHVTITVDTANGVTFYKDGQKAIYYPITKDFTAGQPPAVVPDRKVSDFVNLFVSKVKETGLTAFYGNNLQGDDARICKVMTDEEVAAMYASQNLFVTSVKAGTSTIASFNTYALASTSASYSDANYTVAYVKEPADDETVADDVNKPAITFTAAKVNPAAIYTSKTLTALVSTDFTVTMVERTTPVVDAVGKTTKYSEIYKISNGSVDKLIKIDFTRNDDLSEAMKKLSAIRVGGALVSGFDSEEHTYSYNLAPSVSAIPAVTWDAATPALVTITSNASATFDGKTFEYVISIADSAAPATPIATYTINFTRATSAVVSVITIDGSAMYNFKGSTYFAESEGVQKAYTNQKYTEADKVTIELAYSATAEVSAKTIDATSGRISITVKDTVSQETKNYAIDQQVIDAGSPDYDKVLNSGTLDVEGSNVTTNTGTVTAGERNISLGESASVKIDGAFANNEDGLGEAINADGITVMTWVKLPSSSGHDWAGIFTLTGISAGSSNNRTFILNQSGGLCGTYATDDGWINPAGAGEAGSTRFVSTGAYKLAAVVFSGNKAHLYVDGALITSADTGNARPNANTVIYLGKSHMAQYLGKGDYRNFMIYNAPLSQRSIQDIVAQQTASLLTSLKFEGATENVYGFSGTVSTFNVEYSSPIANPTINDFPNMVATNAQGAVVVVKGESVSTVATGKMLVYTITSEAYGFINTYTVNVTMVNNDSAPTKFTIQYEGEFADINDEILPTAFTAGSGTVKTYTYNVWENADLDGFVINISLKAGQSKEEESFNKTTGIYTVTIYAPDASSTTYRISFVESASVTNPNVDPDAPAPSTPGGCGSVGFAGGSGNGGIGILLAAAALMFVCFRLKKEKTINS